MSESPNPTNPSQQTSFSLPSSVWEELYGRFGTNIEKNPEPDDWLLALVDAIQKVWRDEDTTRSDISKLEHPASNPEVRIKALFACDWCNGTFTLEEGFRFLRVDIMNETTVSLQELVNSQLSNRHIVCKFCQESEPVVTKVAWSFLTPPDLLVVSLTRHTDAKIHPPNKMMEINAKLNITCYNPPLDKREAACESPERQEKSDDRIISSRSWSASDDWKLPPVRFPIRDDDNGGITKKVPHPAGVNVYSLWAVVCQKGTLEGQHYSFHRNQAGVWTTCNDNSTSTVPEDFVVSEAADYGYLLMFQPE